MTRDMSRANLFMHIASLSSYVADTADASLRFLKYFERLENGCLEPG